LLSQDVDINTQEIVILSVVLYEYENCSSALREGHRPNVLENRMLRRIIGPKRDDVTGGWEIAA
jgi:hypothetical protein